MRPRTKYQSIEFVRPINSSPWGLKMLRADWEWECLNRKNGESVGYIAYDCSSDLYVFEPNECSIFSSGYLRDIATFMDKLYDARKAMM